MALRRTKSRAKKLSSPHDVYSLTCSCGENLTGERDTEPLILSCPRCSEQLYVLPRDVYPRPQVLAQDSELLDAPEAESAAPGLSIEEVEDEDHRLAEPQDDTPPRIWVDRPRGALVRKRILQVGGLILTLLLATWWGISWRAARTEAEATFHAQSEAAWEFVSDAEWDRARQAAEQAVDAADFLGRDDPASKDIRDLRDELVILSNLSSLSLIEIVLQKMEEKPAPEKWETLFSIRHGGRWLLLEGEIVREETEDRKRYRFEYPITMPGQQVELVWDQPVEAFEKPEWSGDRFRAFIAVRMQEVRFLDGESDVWQIILSPEEVRFWTTPVLLTAALGVDLSSPEAASLKQLIESQAPDGRFDRANSDKPSQDQAARQRADDPLLGENL